jgi:hypothetical protein
VKILESDVLTPEFLSNIDKKKNIIISVPTNDETIKELSSQIDIFSIKTTELINLSNITNRISPSLLSLDFYPNLKISIPSGIKINFKSPYSYYVPNESGDIFQKVYVSIDPSYILDSEEKISHILFEKIKLTTYIDVIELRKTSNQLSLSKGTNIAELFFTWYIQTSTSIPIIENIYLIQNSEIYETFKKIF